MLIKQFGIKEAAISVIVAVFSSLCTAFFSALVTWASINGSIQYGFSENSEAQFVSIYVTNHKRTPISARLAITNENISIVSSNGIASAKIEKASVRKGIILTIDDVPAESRYALILKTPEGANIPVKIDDLSSTGELSISNIDIPESPVDWVSLAIQTILNFFAMYLLFVIIENQQQKRAYELAVSQSELKIELKESKLRIENIDGELKRRTSTMTKARILYQKNLSMVIKENDFWRGIFQKIITNSGANKNMAKTLISVVSDKLDAKINPDDIDRINISSLIELVVDGERSKHLNRLINN